MGSVDELSTDSVKDIIDHVRKNKRKRPDKDSICREAELRYGLDKDSVARMLDKLTLENKLYVKESYFVNESQGNEKDQLSDIVLLEETKLTDVVDDAKYLGVQLDKHLVWDGHTKALRSKISRSLGFLKYAKKLLPKYTLSQMYRGIVEPHFRYCCSVWGGCGDSRLLMLEKLQNRAARIVTNSSYDTPAANLIKELKWPTVHDMIKQETATIVFKSINGLAPTYLSTLFTRNSAREIVNLRNRETDLLAPRMKTSNGQKAFSFRGAKVWNELKHEVKLAPSLSTFKCRLKCK